MSQKKLFAIIIMTKLHLNSINKKRKVSNNKNTKIKLNIFIKNNLELNILIEKFKLLNLRLKRKYHNIN